MITIFPAAKFSDTHTDSRRKQPSRNRMQSRRVAPIGLAPRLRGNTSDTAIYSTVGNMDKVRRGGFRRWEIHLYLQIVKEPVTTLKNQLPYRIDL